MAMNIPNILIIVFMTYYTKYFIRLFSSLNRKGIQVTNKKLDKLRTIPVKSVEEQKKFIDLRYPKGTKFKFSWKIVPKFLFDILLFILIFRGYIFLFDWWFIEMRLWQSILFIIVVPILFNIVLEKFNLQKGDLRIFMK